MYRVMMLPVLVVIFISLTVFCENPRKTKPKDTMEPIRTVIDINIGEKRKVLLSNGEQISLELLALDSHRDPLCSSIRSASALVRVDKDTVTLGVANYNLPVAVGQVRIDCPVTRDFYHKSLKNWWALENDARLRLWPIDSPFISPGTFAYPICQRWLASKSQMCSEPTFVDGGENPLLEDCAYHAPLDFGGAEGLDQVLSAVAGLVIIAGDSSLPGYEELPFEPGYDNVVILDARGWYHRYWHLFSIEPEIAPGTWVDLSQPVGLLGKEGCSGGWAHLHYEIVNRKPSGRWGNEDGYAYIWQAYIDQYKPELLAVARPHQLVPAGDTITLDGSKSWSSRGDELQHKWHFSDGTKAHGSSQKRSYDSPGNYQEILEITDRMGNRAYDFADVEVIDKNKTAELPLSIHAAFHPTFGITTGDTVTFMVRSFNTLEGSEVWDFGDGSPRVTVKSHESFAWRYERFTSQGLASRKRELHPEGYACTTHCFAEPGDYMVKVERKGDFGYTGVAHLHVRVGSE